MSVCPLCGRSKRLGEFVCEYCSSMLCEICGENLSRGYCAVCGRLVCEKDSKLVGFARVCNDCLARNLDLISYDELKRFLRVRVRYVEWSGFNLNRVIEKNVREFSSDKVFLHIGIDDTDSPYGMCTTYLGALIYEKLLSIGEPMDYPLLIRLNPNVPVKTRGNGSVAVRFLINVSKLDEVREIVIDAVMKASHSFFRKTNPAVVFYVTDHYSIDKSLYSIYVNSLRDITPFSFFRRAISRLSYGYLEVFAGSENSRGIIGATAAVGSVLDDYTYELLVYRREESLGEPRRINVNSVIEMDKRYRGYTFDNIDDGRLLIAPVGPDPVLFGIRGDVPEKLIEAFKLIKHEPFSLWVIFRSNQGTHGHVVRIDSPHQARPYQTVMLRARVSKVERRGDKVFLYLERDDWLITGRIYKMQRELQRYALNLRPGDEVLLISFIFARGRNNLIVNIEEFITLKLVPEITIVNPFCPNCGSRLKKKDKNTYICRNCHEKFNYPYKLVIIRPRERLSERKRYESPPRAHRHLTLPTKRLFFRARKISNLIKPYLINPVIGREKDVKVGFVRFIEPLKIIE